MNVFDAIKGRRSIRSFEDRLVESEKIGQILEACRWSPSAGNREPWEVIVVDDDKIKEELAHAALDQMWITSAPVVFAVCINKSIAKATYGKRGDLYAIQSTAAATQNMMLTAYSLGLGSCWTGAFEEDEVSKVLGCPDDVRPVALIPIGYPKENPQSPPRNEITDFSHLNKYGRIFKPVWKGAKKYKEKIRKKLLKNLEEF